MQAGNELSKKLLARLEDIGRPAQSAYVPGGRGRCVGVTVTDAADAALLGMALGGGWGSVDYECLNRSGATAVLLFVDAKVIERL